MSRAAAFAGLAPIGRCSTGPFVRVKFGALRGARQPGAAIAALGGYLLHTRAPLPVSLRIRQGDHLERPASGATD